MITTSGSATPSKLAPGWPACFPARRPLARRKDLGAGLAYPSDDGGFDEFREFFPTRASNSETRSVSA